MSNQFVPGACVGTPQGLGYIQNLEHWPHIHVSQDQILVRICLQKPQTPIVVNVSECKLMAEWPKSSIQHGAFISK